MIALKTKYLFQFSLSVYVYELDPTHMLSQGIKGHPSIVVFPCCY